MIRVIAFVFFFSFFPKNDNVSIIGYWRCVNLSYTSYKSDVEFNNDMDSLLIFNLGRQVKDTFCSIDLRFEDEKYGVTNVYDNKYHFRYTINGDNLNINNMRYKILRLEKDTLVLEKIRDYDYLGELFSDNNERSLRGEKSVFVRKD